MLIGKTIYLRLFEVGDYEQTYHWHSDPDIQASLCAPHRFISHEIEKNWVTNKATNNMRDIYLAICDKATDKMIGWYSINDIDYRNRKCHCGGVIIGDKDFRGGDAYQEAGLMALDYLFDEMNMHRVTGSCLSTHIMSRATMESRGYKLEAIEREAIFKGGKYHDICKYSILEEEYRRFKTNFNDQGYLLQLAKNVRRIKSEI